MNKLSKKKKIALIVLLILGIYIFGYGTMALFICSLIGVFPTSKSKRQKLVNYYSEDSNYTVIYGRANLFCYYEDDGYFTIYVTLKQVLSDNADNKRYIPGETYYYLFLPANRKVLEENGISEFYGETTEQRGYTYYAVDQIITLTVCEEGSIGLRPYAVALSAGDIEYLSYETGKANIVNYIANEMH